MSTQIADLDATLIDRGGRYGPFRGQAEVTTALKEVLANELCERCKKLPPIQQEALDMIFHKIGRIVNGDNYCDDSWHDIAGYAELVVKDLNGKGVAGTPANGSGSVSNNNPPKPPVPQKPQPTGGRLIRGDVDPDRFTGPDQQHWVKHDGL